MEPAITGFDLSVRYQIYRFFAEHSHAPSYQELAASLSEEEEDVRASFHKLHARHMIFLEPGTDSIRMANPFSAVPTKFNVRSGGKEWWANCAWDAFGIAAALRIDVQIEAGYPDSTEIIELQVIQGMVDGKNHLVHFPIPFRQWYLEPFPLGNRSRIVKTISLWEIPIPTQKIRSIDHEYSKSAPTSGIGHAAGPLAAAGSLPAGDAHAPAGAR
jgi:hypothetical protein